MNFELSEEQTMLQDGLRTLLASACPISRVRERSVEKLEPDRSLWRALAENGWTGIGVSEKQGGAGLGFEEAMIVAREVGRAILHQPLTDTIAASRAIERHASNARHRAALAAVAVGDQRLAIALRDAPEVPEDAGAIVQADVAQGGWRVNGTARAVAHGLLAEACLVEARLADGKRMLFLLDSQQHGIRWVERSSLDRSVRRFDLRLDDVQIDRQAAFPAFSEAAPEIERIIDEWRVLLAAENEGACRRMLEMAVDYVGKREQFGRPVGANQAVKVRVAEMAAAIERMTAAIYFAAMKLDQDAPDAPLAAAMAKNAAGAPASFVATQAIHVHGAIAFTWEQDVHLLVKRVKSNELSLGGERENLARIAAAVLDGA